MKINWSEPSIGIKEKNAVARIWRSNWLSQGPETERFEQDILKYVGGKNYCTVVNNGTSALITALLAHNIGPGDEVIVPAFTFMAPINAILMVGAKPVLVDPDPETWDLSPRIIEKKITKKTKAIMPVDVAGMPVDIEYFEFLSSENNIPLIIDSAESLGAEFNEEKIGSFDHTCVLSFHMAKQASSIEGGAIITNDKTIDRYCRLIRNHGMESSAYQHSIFGLNFRISDIHSAIGRAQLKKIDKTVEHRNYLANAYKMYLGYDFKYQRIPDYVTKHPYMFFGVLTEERNKVIKTLERHSIPYRITWPYIMDQPYHRRLFKNQKFPVAKMLSEQVIALPMGNKNTVKQIKYVCRVLSK